MRELQQPRVLMVEARSRFRQAAAPHLLPLRRVLVVAPREGPVERLLKPEAAPKVEAGG